MARKKQQKLNSTRRKEQRVIREIQKADRRNRDLTEARSLGLKHGREEGLIEGKRIAENLAHLDLAAVWNQVAQFSQAASNYAAAISTMHKGQAPQPVQAMSLADEAADYQRDKEQRHAKS